MRLNCNDQIKPLNIKEIVKGSLSPIAIQLSAFVGELEYLMNFPRGPSFQLCGYHFNEAESITAVSYYNNFESLADRTYLMIVKEDETYTILLTLSHKDLVTSFSASNISDLKLCIKSGQSREANNARVALVIVQGENLTHCLELTFKTALKETGGFGKLPPEKFPLPQFFNRLGWQAHCTLSHGQLLSHDKIIRSIKELQTDDIRLGYVLIEEGWQQVCSGTPQGPSLVDFDADRVRFPLGLKGLISEIHTLGIRQVGVWHSSMGYRGGIHSRLAKNYDLPPDSIGRYFLGYDLGRTFQFFYDYYAFLKDQGVTFIQVGDQINTSHYLRAGMDSTRLYKNLQMAIQGASTLHFQTPHLNTDCLRDENLFYWTASRVARCTKNVDAEDEKGLFQDIHNKLATSLWLQHLMQPDFDAWTPTSYSETQAIFHALSGTFNVISHRLNAQENSLLKKMVLPCGDILKADKLLTLCPDSIFVDPLKDEKVYKAYTLKNKSGVIALFNFSEDKKGLMSTVSAQDVENLDSEYFTAFSYRHGFLGIVKKEEQIPIKLKAKQSDVITFSPLKNGISLIGSYCFFLTQGIIIEWTLEEDTLHISSLIAAPILLYTERDILEVRWNGQVIPWSYDIRLKIASIDQRSHVVDTPSLYTIHFEA